MAGFSVASRGLAENRTATAGTLPPGVHTGDGVAFNAGVWVAKARPLAPSLYGSTGGDWGPAVRQALTDANTNGTWVEIDGVYSVSTAITWPSTGSSVEIRMTANSQLTRAANIVLVDMSGTDSGAGQARNRYIKGPGYLDGGSNTGWNLPLLRQQFTGDCGSHDIRFLNAFGPAIDATHQCWDAIHKNPQISLCGNTDGTTYAIMAGTTAGDSGNVTNCFHLESPRIEAFRSGAISIIGADAGDPVFEAKITGAAKIELGGASPMIGPAIRLSHITRYVQQGVRFTMDTSGGFPGYATLPLDAFMLIDNCKSVQLGEMWGDVGSLTSAAQVASLIHFNGGNREISWKRFDLIPGSGSVTNKPACVFLWSATNEMVDEGTYACDNDFMSIPKYTNAPTNLARRNGGTYTVTPGAVTSVSIPHGIGDFSTNPNPGQVGTSSFLTPLIPSRASVQPANANARGAPAFHLTFTNSSVVLNFASALTAATSYSWVWSAEV